MRVTRCFSFDPAKDKDLLDYIDGLQNASGHIRELLRLELGMKVGDPFLDRIIRGVLARYEVAPSSHVESPRPVDIDRDSILDILNMK